MAGNLRAGSSLIDLIDRVLDKGIVILRAWAPEPLTGPDLFRVQTRVVVSPLNTYLRAAGAPAGATLKPSLLLREAGGVKKAGWRTLPFKLVTQYDSRNNEYAILNHNLTEKQALEAVAEHCARAFSVFIVDQKAKHKAKQVGTCLACRTDLERAVRIQPGRKFKRKDSAR